MIKSSTIFLLAILASVIATSAEAQQRRTHRQQTVVTCNERGCSDFAKARRAAAVDASGAETTPTARAARNFDANGNTVVIGGRPAGCPHRYCGCEASRYVFGKIRPELNLASNWIKYFPRTSPAPGMAAARGGHVMVLISHAGGNDWLVHDGNSGGGLTRRHVRSIRGYVIVDPHSTRAAEKTKTERHVGTTHHVGSANAAAYD